MKKSENQELWKPVPEHHWRFRPENAENLQPKRKPLQNIPFCWSSTFGYSDLNTSRNKTNPESFSGKIQFWKTLARGSFFWSYLPHLTFWFADWGKYIQYHNNCMRSSKFCVFNWSPMWLYLLKGIALWNGTAPFSIWLSFWPYPVSWSFYWFGSWFLNQVVRSLLCPRHKKEQQEDSVLAQRYRPCLLRKANVYGSSWIW